MLQNRFYTVREVAEITGISEFTIRKFIRDGKLRTACKRGISYMISLDNLMDFSKSRPNYSYIENIISNDNISIVYESRNDFSLKSKKIKRESNDIIDLKIRIKELELQLLKYESKFGPLE